MRASFATLSRALEIAARQGMIPSALGSAGLRQAFAASIRRNAVFSARTVNTVYLDELAKAAQRIIVGGYGNDKPKVRLDLKLLLQRLGYDPATGFPGDEALGIPPAEPGSLQDLGSDARLNLILEMLVARANGKAMQLEGLDPFILHYTPCWELARIETRRVPRGSIDTGSPGWGERWVKLGGPPLVTSGGRTRMIAPKTHPIWAALGDSAIYDDCLDSDYPPWAFRSGYGWLPVDLDECGRLKLDVTQAPVAFVADVPEKPVKRQSVKDKLQVPVAMNVPTVKLQTVTPERRQAAIDWLAAFDKEFAGGVN